MSILLKNPITRKRLARFKEVRHAWASIWILLGLYLISLCAELISNGNPLYVRFKGHSYFPAFFFYSEEIFIKGGRKTRPDYKAINAMAMFMKDPANRMIFSPIPFGPFESIDPASIPVSEDVVVLLTPIPAVGSVNIDKAFSIISSLWFAPFSGEGEGRLVGKDLRRIFHLSPDIVAAIKARFTNMSAPAFTEEVEGKNDPKVRVYLSTFTPRDVPPESVRLTFREVNTPGAMKQIPIVFSRQDKVIKTDEKRFPVIQSFSPEDRRMILEQIENRFRGPVEPFFLTHQNRRFQVDLSKEEVRFPYPPIKGHRMGIDAAGRDVLARILYGLRTSMTFGLLLVAGSMALGIFAGAIQGYYGGLLDITAQRFVEIWSALPFLYIMILMGSVYGRSFSLLLFCYGLFNWIGISYYARAEFLRLRRQSFVEAARCMGISTPKILFRHILPNALVPVITFFPFSLVGAIGSLAALDYLGFGLPPPTPSWGELLFQAQQYRWAWWLILYPSGALFIVMLLGVFIGEGVRNAYDPKRYARME